MAETMTPMSTKTGSQIQTQWRKVHARCRYTWILQPKSPTATATTSNACLIGENSSAAPGTYATGKSTANTKSAQYTIGAPRNSPASDKKIFSANDRTFFM